jgi:DNA-binding MarR family transcriptional regulator
MEAMRQRYPDMETGAMVPYLHFLRCSAELVSYVERQLGSHGMAMGRMTVMMTLNMDPEQSRTPGDIAERCGVTAATITRLVDGLVADGFVERSADLRDRRSYQLKLTEAGRAQLEGLLPQHLRNISDIFSGFNASERKEFARLMEKLYEQLKRKNAEIL